MKEFSTKVEEEDFMGISKEYEFSSPEEEIVTEPIVTKESMTEKNPGKPDEKNRKKPERESISNWFNHQFGGLFSDEDAEVK